MPKKIAVIISGRSSEALRMSLGLTLVDDHIDVFMMDHEFERDGGAESDLELLREMDIGVYSNSAGIKEVEYLPTEEVARRLVEYDHILPY